MNMLLALFVFIAISYGSVQVSTSDEIFGKRVKESSLMVMDASPESPAFKAGIIPGSILLKVTSSGASANLTEADSFVSFVGAHANSPFIITYKDPKGVTSETTVAAVYGIIPEKKALGVSVDTVGYVKTTFLEAFTIGFTRTYEITSMTIDGLRMVASSVINGENVMSSLSGPIGIAKIVGQTSEYGVKAVLTLVAVLSINLAIFNILPLPALDGGRMVVVIIETIIRRKVPYAYYSWVNVIGFLALMLLLVLVTVHDVRG
jgi:regulator of sigma E protease